MLPWIWDYLVLGCLTNWIRDYRKNGYNVIDKPMGRPRKKTITKRNQKKIKPEGQGALKKAVIVLLFGEIGYWAYSAAPQAAHINGMHPFCRKQSEW